MTKIDLFRELATLLEGAGYQNNYFECEYKPFNSFMDPAVVAYSRLTSLYHMVHSNTNYVPLRSHLKYYNVMMIRS